MAYEKNTVSLRDPALLKRLRAVAKKLGMGSLSNVAILKIAITQWCDQQAGQGKNTTN